MNETITSDSAGSLAAEALTGGADTVAGLAMLGKTTVALALVIAAILLCAWLLRRLNGARHLPGQALRVVGSTAVGQRERVVIVAVEDTWLVLGVGGGQVSKLHQLPAPPAAPAYRAAQQGGFAERLARALRQSAAPREPDGKP